ncbi:MAG TPA: UbiA family prenyltransferase, partial [Gemmatimonadales bacterium]|nr:UbiA family prenyltransferase [Gemmatimonadales bacterium]
IVLGMSAAALVSGRQVLIALLALAVMLGYSPLLKRHGVPGNIAVAVVGGLPLFYGALAMGRPGAGIVPWVLAAWLQLSRELVKDLGDEAGDRAAGRRTLPVRVGLARATRIAGWTCLAVFPLALVLPLLSGYGSVYLDVASLSLVAVAVAVLAIRRQRFVTASGLLKVAMVFGLGALVLGRVV